VIRAAALSALLLVAARDDPLAGRTAGPAVDCIDLDFVQGPDIVDRRTILYRQNAGRIWRTGPVDGCGTMRTGDGIIAEVQGRRLCRNDRFRVRTNSVVLGRICRFGPFVPYDLKGRSG
jgi:hypothetical protein